MLEYTNTISGKQVLLPFTNNVADITAKWTATADLQVIWKEQNMGTVVVGAIVVVIAGVAIRSIRKDKKSGKGCNGNCGSCGGCH